MRNLIWTLHIAAVLSFLLHPEGFSLEKKEHKDLRPPIKEWRGLVHGMRPTKLDDTVSSFTLRDMNLIGFFNSEYTYLWFKALNVGEIDYDYVKIMGENHKIINISLNQVTVRDVLNKLTAADPRYRWEEENGVVNFIPTVEVSGRPDVAGILEREVGVFSLKNASIAEAIDELISQARSQGITELKEPRLEPFREDRTIRHYWVSEAPKLTFTIRNKTLRQCLNAIVAADPPGIWFAGPYGDKVTISATYKHTHKTLETSAHKEDMMKYDALAEKIDFLFQKQDRGLLTKSEKTELLKLQGLRNDLKKHLWPN